MVREQLAIFCCCFLFFLATDWGTLVDVPEQADVWTRKSRATEIAIPMKNRGQRRCIKATGRELIPEDVPKVNIFEWCPAAGSRNRRLYAPNDFPVFLAGCTPPCLHSNHLISEMPSKLPPCHDERFEWTRNESKLSLHMINSKLHLVPVAM